MKSTFLTYIFLSISFLSFGNVNIDSLINIWQTELSSALKFKAYNELCSIDYIASHPDSAFLFSEQAYNLAIKKDLEKEKANALYNMGISSIYLSNNNEAVKYLKRSIEITDKNEEFLKTEKLKNKEILSSIYLERLGWLGSFSLLFLLTGYFVKSKFSKLNTEKEQLYSKQIQLNSKIQSLKEKLATQSVSVTTSNNNNFEEGIQLDKVKLEKAINSKIGESSWMILNLIFKNPTSSNKEIAKEVSLSLEGVSSSLRRMYVAFGVKSASNKKIALIQKAVHISIED